MTAVRSSSLAAVGHNALTQTLQVRFRNGGIYQYYSVPRRLYTGLMGAASKGGFFRRHILNHYSDRKLS